VFNVKIADKNVQFTFNHLRGVGEGVGISDVTVCTVIVNGEEFRGMAACSEKDVFVKEIGRRIALRRALGAARETTELAHEVREAVWKRYWTRDIPNADWTLQEPDGTIVATGLLDEKYSNIIPSEV
jgi:hypothetical protein